MKRKLAVYALIGLYADLAGKVPNRRYDPERLRRDMWHVEKVIRMFEPRFDVAMIKPKRPYRENRIVRHGQGFRAALDILRQANGPMTVREIATRLLAARGVVAPTPRVLKGAVQAVWASLRNHQGKSVQCVSGSLPARWTVEG